METVWIHHTDEHTRGRCPLLAKTQLHILEVLDEGQLRITCPSYSQGPFVGVMSGKRDPRAWCQMCFLPPRSGRCGGLRWRCRCVSTGPTWGRQFSSFQTSRSTTLSHGSDSDRDFCPLYCVADWNQWQIPLPAVLCSRLKSVPAVLCSRLKSVTETFARFTV